jgi:alpha-glucosidase
VTGPTTGGKGRRPSLRRDATREWRAAQGARRWWQDGIIYEIFPLSFMDGDGDGIGDLKGIARRLDYVASLGVDAVWLTPIYPSPLKDFGYDVSDYTGVHPRLGSLAVFDDLVARVHGRGLRIILDLVPNHTSDQHPWFIASRSSRADPKRDWYLWRDPAPGGGPPNNWVSYFGSGWTFDPTTGQYYFHQFRDAQPELNYGNPDVLGAMLDVMRFWLDRGVDGFRVDVIPCLAKDPEFRDDPPNPDFAAGQSVYFSVLHDRTRNQPAGHQLVRRMRRALDEYDDRVLIGELDPSDGLVAYYGRNLDECHLPFNFNLIFEPWDPRILRPIIDAYDASLPEGAWPDWVIGNHDQRRIASRVGDGQARVAQMLLLTLRGTPICYYGDELGMANTVIPAARMLDRNGMTDDEIERNSRDPARTPMQWDAGPNAGFCPPGVDPWLPVSGAHALTNVAVENADPRSMLNLFRRLAAIRRETLALTRGTYRSVDPGVARVLMFERAAGRQRIEVCLNLSSRPATVAVGELGRRGEILVSTHLDRQGVEMLQPLKLRSDEGVVVRLLDGAVG